MRRARCRVLDTLARQADAPGGGFSRRAPRRRLERRDLLADQRTRAIQVVGRAREVAEVGDARTKVQKLVETIHRGSFTTG